MFGSFPGRHPMVYAGTLKALGLDDGHVPTFWLLLYKGDTETAVCRILVFM